MKPIAIIGAGGLGIEVLALVRSLPEWSPIGFFDDGLKRGQVVNNIEVLGGVASLRERTERIDLVIAIGDPIVKAKVAERLKGLVHLTFPVLVHAAAVLVDSTTMQIGEGTIVCPGAILTSNISVGKHVLININSTIGHNSVIGPYCSLMPGSNLAGNVKLGERTMIGAGANIRNGVSIGSGSVVGMGSVVLKDVLPSTTVVGVPAKVIKRSWSE